jgi:hypothetical protein
MARLAPNAVSHESQIDVGTTAEEPTMPAPPEPVIETPSEKSIASPLTASLPESPAPAPATVAAAPAPQPSATAFEPERPHRVRLALLPSVANQSVGEVTTVSGFGGEHSGAGVGTLSIVSSSIH